MSEKRAGHILTSWCGCAFKLAREHLHPYIQQPTRWSQPSWNQQLNISVKSAQLSSPSLSINVDFVNVEFHKYWR